MLHTPLRGLPRGCPLSPLLAGFHLFELDRDLAARTGVRYRRFMDDLLILARTRWQLRRAVAAMRQWMSAARLALHPDKTVIGRMAAGFDWLGDPFDASGLCGVSARALEHARAKVLRLYEQARRRDPQGDARGGVEDSLKR